MYNANCPLNQNDTGVLRLFVFYGYHSTFPPYISLRLYTHFTFCIHISLHVTRILKRLLCGFIHLYHKTIQSQPHTTNREMETRVVHNLATKNACNVRYIRYKKQRIDNLRWSMQNSSWDYIYRKHIVNEVEVLILAMIFWEFDFAFELVEHFLDELMNINYKIHTSGTFLHVFARFMPYTTHSNTRLINLLGLLPDEFLLKTDKYGYTFVHAFISHRNKLHSPKVILDYICDRLGDEILLNPTKRSNTFLHMAWRNGDVVLINYLYGRVGPNSLSLMDNKGNTPFHLFCDNDDGTYYGDTYVNTKFEHICEGPLGPHRNDWILRRVNELITFLPKNVLDQKNEKGYTPLICLEQTTTLERTEIMQIMECNVGSMTKRV